ncbi:MAG: hypothetical protein Q4B73_07760, partial [Lachnospiraceae bacterium]|nr:hypothetical protein [Lachnospiraceae bacterium]
MDKIEYKEKLDEINHLAEEGDFAGAVEVVDTIDWRHVKSARTLCMVGEIYEANKRFDDAVRVLKYAYKRSSGSKTVVYRLAELSLRYGDTAAARGYAREFAELSPNDAARFALDYKIKRAEGSSLDEQIRVLEEMKEREYTERWSYELARLYMKNGQEDKCVETCDDMILWFAEGKYVQKAMELKKQIRPLTPAQQMKYEAMTGQTPVSTPEPVQEEPAQDNRKPAQIVSEAIDKMDSAAAKAIPEDRAPSSARVNVRRGEGRETFASNANKDQLADSIRAVFSGLQQPAPTLNTDIEMTEQFSDADVDAYIAGKSDNMAQYRVRSLEPESIAEGAVKTDMPEEEDGRQMTFDDYRKPVAEVDLSALFAETKDALAGEIASGVFEKTGVVEEEVPEVEETPVVEEAPVVAEAPIVEEAP